MPCGLLHSLIDPGAQVFQSKTLDFDPFILQLVLLIRPTGFIDAAQLYGLTKLKHCPSPETEIMLVKEIHLKQAAEMPPSLQPTKL